jgi:hypothetical protein
MDPVNYVYTGGEKEDCDPAARIIFASGAVFRKKSKKSFRTFLTQRAASRPYIVIL